ncbi:MAG: serine/threonine protein kinase, partial [Gemmatimonadales bacterium]
MKFCPVCGEHYGEAEKFCPADGTTLRATDPGSDLVDQVIADRYHIRGRLGEGGMGIVYLAEHVRMSRPCAIKVLSSTLTADAEAITRFNREAANASRINHPNVCAVYDFGETPDGIIYLAMEFVDGETLTTLLERGQLPLEETAEILSQCAAGLHAAHELGIVHRDLKPDNIMLVEQQGRRQVKVVDFGIAKAGAEKAQQVTRTGLVVGTPEYMSPEQVSGDTLDARSDIYALALICYRMLTGATPFQSENQQEALTRRLTDPPAPIALARPDLAFPPGLQEVLDRGLARRPGERFATVTGFTDALSRVARSEGESPSGAATQVMAPAGGDTVPPTRVASRVRPSFRVAPLALGTGIVLA